MTGRSASATMRRMTGLPAPAFPSSRLRRAAAGLACAALLAPLGGCAVVAVTGAAVGTAASVAGTAVSTTVSVAGTAVKTTGKVVGKTVDVLTPSSAPDPVPR